jgi:hypothetical protein
MKQIMYSCLLLIGIGIIITGCNKTKSEMGFTEKSFQTSSITIYSDGYYGGNMDEPLTIVDKDVVAQMIELASSINDYSLVKEGDQLEGVNGLWVDFNNETIIGMYEDIDYGTVGHEITLIGAPNYHLPNGYYIDYGYNTYIETLAFKLESRIDAVTESVYINLDGIIYELPLSEEQLEYDVNEFVLNNQVVFENDIFVLEDIRLVALER